ncbi:MAG: hypothetical protein Tsb0013_00100 [Phycisphaerales bacterium]
MASKAATPNGHLKLVLGMTVVGVVLGGLAITALSRPDLLSRFAPTTGATESQEVNSSSAASGDDSAVILGQDDELTQEEWDEIYAQWIDEAAGHPDDPMLPRSVLGASDSVLLATDPLEIADMLRTTREFVEERSSSPRHAFALGRAAWTHGYDRIGLQLMESAAEQGSAAALAYLGYDAEERGELEMARHFFERAQAQGFRSRDVADAVVALSEPLPGVSSDDGIAVTPDATAASDPFGLPPLPEFDPEKFNRPDLIRALYEGDLETLNADPTWNTIYVANLHDTLADQGTLFFVEDKTFALEIDPGIATRARARLAGNTQAVSDMANVGLGALMDGFMAIAETRRSGGTIGQEVAAMNSAIANRVTDKEVLAQHAVNDGRRLAIMYDASPDEFRQVYRGIRKFFGE